MTEKKPFNRVFWDNTLLDAISIAYAAFDKNFLLFCSQTRVIMVILSDRCESGTSTHHERPLQVGFYEIIKTLGKGTFAVVKLARHKVTKTQVSSACFPL